MTLTTAIERLDRTDMPAPIRPEESHVRIAQEDPQLLAVEGHVLGDTGAVSSTRVKQGPPFDLSAFKKAVQIVIRTFYSDSEIVVVDALLRANASLQPSDIEARTCLSRSTVQVALTKLEKDQLLEKTEKKEEDKNQQGQTGGALLPSRRGAGASNANSYYSVSRHMIAVSLWRVSQLRVISDRKCAEAGCADTFRCPQCDHEIDALVAVTESGEQAGRDLVCSKHPHCRLVKGVVIYLYLLLLFIILIFIYMHLILLLLLFLFFNLFFD
eukprot:GHVR01166587.1.p1 GENE.GHVR01166587.1~~GHVR01166587.1.p1  ORF type:complete len:270 (-),score=70.23 GHVR01166587.1:54-863(-)